MTMIEGTVDRTVDAEKVLLDWYGVSPEQTRKWFGEGKLKSLEETKGYLWVRREDFGQLMGEMKALIG